MEHIQSVHMHLPEKTPRLWWQRWGFALLKPCLWTRPLLHPRGVSMYQKCAVPWQLHWPGSTQVRGYLSPDDHPCLPISETTFNKKENLNTFRKQYLKTFVLLVEYRRCGALDYLIYNWNKINWSLIGSKPCQFFNILNEWNAHFFVNTNKILFYLTRIPFRCQQSQHVLH